MYILDISNPPQVASVPYLCATTNIKTPNICPSCKLNVYVMPQIFHGNHCKMLIASVMFPLIAMQGRTNLSPDKVPWSALRTLLSQCIYGGRIDNDFDQRLLNSFVNRLFTVQSFDSTFPLMNNIDGQPGKKINMPEGIR